MQILIDNIDLLDYDIKVLDYTGALSFASERTNERTWADKSGVDKNLVNIKYDTKEFYLKCIAKATNEVAAYNIVKVLIDYMYSRGVFVLSLRDPSKGIRECFLCERSGALTGEVSVRAQNGLYVFKLGLRDVNPNALKYKNTITSSSSSILYEKGQTAVIYWGEGARDEVSNSGIYTYGNYVPYEDFVDIIVDIDKNAPTVAALIADFTADITSGIKEQLIQFTDASTGGVVIYSWDFGDQTTSDLQNPSHLYAEIGTYTVTLQVFNSEAGSAIEEKTNYITIRSARLLINNSGDFLTINNAGDKLLKN